MLRFGQYAASAFPTAPPEVATVLETLRERGTPFTVDDIENLFEKEPTAISLVGVSFEGPTAFEALSYGLMTCGRLTHLSLRGTRWPVGELANALASCPSLITIDVAACGLTPGDAKTMVDVVVVYNRTIVAWDVAENRDLAEDGVMTLLRGFDGVAHPVEELGLRGCGLQANAIPAAVEVLQRLPYLRCVDLGDSPATKEAASAVQRLNVELRERAARDTNAVFVPLRAATPRDGTVKGPGPSRTTPTATHRVMSTTPGDRASTPPRRASLNGATPPSATRGTASTPVVRRPLTGGNTPQRSPSAKPFIKTVDDGADEWRRVRDSYNRYIRGNTTSPSRARSPAPPPLTFVFGQRVDKLREHGSASFVRPSRVSRAATPSERRKLAPWVDGRSTRGTVTYVLDPKCDPRNPTYIEIVDGGDVTLIDRHPRDISYEAQRAREAGAATRPTNAFASNTPREVRFGVGKGEVVRRAQAPGPAYYAVPSEWDLLVQKARQKGRPRSCTGKSMFGCSAEPRQVFRTEKSSAPGPGAYEIP